jgi:hypothetical protein
MFLGVTLCLTLKRFAMKKLIYSIGAFAFVLSAVSCSDDDSSSSTTAAELNSTLTSGTWKVTLYKEDDDDQTSNFTGYNFTFGAADVLTAVNGDNTYTGFWSADDDDSSDDVDLDIAFTAPANFAELSEDWDVLERSNTKVRLKHTSGGDGSTDYLTFEKN